MNGTNRACVSERASPTDAELLDQLFDGLGLLLSDAGRQFHPLGAQTDAAAAQVRELDGPAARVTAARLPGQIRSGQVRSGRGSASKEVKPCII